MNSQQEPSIRIIQSMPRTQVFRLSLRKITSNHPNIFVNFPNLPAFPFFQTQTDVISFQSSVYSFRMINIPIDNNTMLEQSKQQLSEYLIANSLLDLSKHLREIKLKQIKDISCVEIYHDTLYVGTNDSKVFVFDIAKQSQQNAVISLINQKSFYPHCSSVHLITASDLYLIVVPLAEQQLIRIWNRETLQILHGYKGHEKQITKVIFLNDKKQLASTSHDGSVRIWDLTLNFQHDEETSKYASRYPILSLIEVDNETIAFGGDDCFITIWNWKKCMVRYKIFAHPGSINGLASCYPFYIYSIGGDAKIRAWKLTQKDEDNHHAQFSFSMSDQILPAEANRQFQLTLSKQYDKVSTQLVHSVKVSNNEALIIDSKGNTYLMNNQLEIISSQFKLDYAQSIRDVQFWRNQLFVVTCVKGKGQLKEINVYFEEMMMVKQRPKDKAVISAFHTTAVEVGTKHSLQTANLEESKKKEIPHLVEDIEQENF